MGHERSPSEAAKRYQFDYAFRCHELQSVDFTAAPNDKVFLRAVDATAASLERKG